MRTEKSDLLRGNTAKRLVACSTAHAGVRGAGEGGTEHSARTEKTSPRSDRTHTTECTLVLHHLPVPVKRPSGGMLYPVTLDKEGKLGVCGRVAEERLLPRHSMGAHDTAAPFENTPGTGVRGVPQHRAATDTRGGNCRREAGKLGGKTEELKSWGLRCSELDMGGGRWRTQTRILTHCEGV